MNKLCKVTSIFCLFFLIFIGLAFYQTITLYRSKGLDWVVNIDGVEVEENIWSYVGSCIFSCLISLVLVANLDRVIQLEKYIKDKDL